MKAFKIKSLISLALAISFIFSAFAVAVSAATNSKGYEEGNGWINENPNSSDDYAYSIAVVGDTQTVVKKDLANDTAYMSSIYDWLVANASAKKIQQVIGLGDIVENDTDDEWTYAKEHITKLDGVIPYLLNRGNSPHDSVKQLNKYFASHTAYTNNISGTMADGNVANAYSIFTAGSTKYLAIALDYGPSDAELAWADGIISMNPDCKVIITTHAYLYSDGYLQGADDSNTPNSTGSNDGANNNGEQMWDKLVKKHQNIVLVLSGHNPSPDVIYRQDTADNGNVVTSMLINSQNFDAGRNGETGMVCMLYFSEDGRKISVEWISTVREQYYKADNQFTLNLMAAAADVTTKYGIIPAQYSDASEYPFIVFEKKADGKGNDYTFYAANKTLFADSTLGLTANADLAFHKLRYAGEGAVILMRRDFINTATGNYSNTALNSGAHTTFDLGGFKLTDKHTSNSGLFYLYGKANATNDVTLTVTNGTILLGEKSMTSYTDTKDATKSLNLVFDGVTIAFQEGSTVSNVFGRYQAGNKNKFSVTVKNSTVDLKNARVGVNLLTDGNNSTYNPITFENTEIINSRIIVPKANMTLSDNFILNVYVPVSTSSSSDCVIKSIVFDGVSYAIADCEKTTIGSVNYYVFSKPVAPTSAADEIDLKVNFEQTISYTDGNKVISNSGTWTFSVISYLEKLSGVSSKVQKTLAMDILSYIRSAYVYFDESENLEDICDKIDWIIGENYNETAKPADMSAVENPVGLDQATFRLESTPAFIFYPETDENGDLLYAPEDYVFALDGKYKLNGKVGTDADGRTYIEVSMYAYAIDNTVEYIVNGTSIHGSYNIRSYYDFAAKGTDAELITLVERLIKYAQSAEAYKNTLD